MPVVMPEKLHRLIVALYEHAGVKSEDDHLIADHQVASRGKASRSMTRLAEELSR